MVILRATSIIDGQKDDTRVISSITRPFKKVGKDNKPFATSR